MTAAPDLFGATASVDASGLIAYLRTSTAAQSAADAYGPAAQLAAIEAWAEANGRTIVAVFRDDGVSGTVPFHQRAGLAAALVRLAADGLDGLIVARLDRLARRLHEQEACLAHVWRTGHGVYAADVGEVRQDDPADPMAAAFRQMMGVFAELERGMIVARMAAGRRAKKAAGGWGSGPAPYGWKLVDAELVEVPEELRLVDRMFAWRREGWTLGAIARELTARGEPTPGGTRTWQASTVRRILCRPQRRPAPGTTASVDA